MMMTVKIDMGRNIVDIKSDGYSDCLLIENNVVAATWRTNLTFYAISKHDELEDKKLYFPTFKFRDEEKIIYQKSQELLESFTDGIYRVEVLEQNIAFVEFATDSSNSIDKFIEDLEGNFTYCRFTENTIVFFSKSARNINTQTVDYYKDEILGNREIPLIIALGIETLPDINEFEKYSFDLHGKFIIDGHHKLLAYEDLKVNPRILCITKLCDNRSIENNFLREYRDVLNIDEFKHYTQLIK